MSPLFECSSIELGEQSNWGRGVVMLVRSVYKRSIAYTLKNNGSWGFNIEPEGSILGRKEPFSQKRFYSEPCEGREPFFFKWFLNQTKILTVP